VAEAPDSFLTDPLTLPDRGGSLAGEFERTISNFHFLRVVEAVQLILDGVDLGFQLPGFVVHVFLLERGRPGYFGVLVAMTFLAVTGVERGKPRQLGLQLSLTNQVALNLSIRDDNPRLQCDEVFGDLITKIAQSGNIHFA